MRNNLKTADVLFIDFYQTLTTDSYWDDLDGNTQQNVERYLKIENRELFFRWMRGYYSDKEVHKILAKELGYQRNTLWSGFITGCKSVSVDEKACLALRNLSPSTNLVLATDNFGCFNKYVIPNTDITDVFDHVYNSFNYGGIKTDNNGEMFQDIANDINCPIESAILLDDQAAVCETFRSLGGSAIQIAELSQTADEISKLTDGL